MMSDVEDWKQAKGQQSVAEDPEGHQLSSQEAVDPDQAEGGGASPDINSRLRFWFWAAIALLAGATISLMIFSHMRQATLSSPHRSTTVESELSPDALANVLSEPNSAALASVLADIPALLDQAYLPVYGRIPEYADFHYSVWGSYVELGTSAMGNPTGKLEEILLTGMDERLREVASTLDANFGREFREGLSRSLSTASANAPSLGPLTRAVIDDARSQIGTSALVLAGGAGATKTFALVVGEKIGAKIAAKAAVKAGAKWGAATTGAISTGALCAWAGPASGACAGVGAVVAWIATDAAVGKLDELISRDEFESELRSLIDEDKEVRSAAFTGALTRKAETLQLGLDTAVQDFTLRQLSGSDATEVCSVAQVIAGEYNEIRDNLWRRRSAHIAEFREVLSAHAGHLALRPLILEIDRNIIESAAQIRIRTVWIRGNLPAEFRGDRDVSAHLLLNSEEFEFGRVPSTEEGGFQIRADPQVWVMDGRHVTVKLRLEQHRLLLNRTFNGEAESDLLEVVAEGHGLLARVYQELPIRITDGEEGRANEEAMPGSVDHVRLEMVVGGKAMPNLQLVPDCPT